MSSDDLQNSGLPLSFSSTKVTKRTEKNRKKKAQKKSRRGNKDASATDTLVEDVGYNYAEEFKVKEVLTEYRKEFTVLMSKSERFKCEDEDDCEEYEEEAFCEEEQVNYRNVNEPLDYEFDPLTNLDILDTTVDTSDNLDTAALATSKPPVKNCLQKYYHQRYDYFSLFDSGIQIDDEGWYSVTPEIVAHHIAKEAHAIALTNKTSSEETKTVIVDAFCGVGGNTIQFAKYFDRVIAIDLDVGRLEMARHNAAIYGVADRIEFVHGDVFTILPNLEKPDVLFMSPPWGGPDYIQQPVFCPCADLLDNRGQELFQLGRNLSKNLILFLPRQSNIFTLAEMMRDEKQYNGILCDDESFVVEQHWLKNRLKAISIYFY